MSKTRHLKPFAPGQSGNPGGRPRLPEDAKQLARGYTRAAIETLASVMQDDEAPAAARVTAASTLLDRAWGKAPQHITTDNLGNFTDAELRAELAAATAELRRYGLDAEGEGPAGGGGEAPTAH